MEGISEDGNTSKGQRSGNDEELIIIFLEFGGKGTIRCVEEVMFLSIAESLHLNCHSIMSFHINVAGM